MNAVDITNSLVFIEVRVFKWMEEEEGEEVIMTILQLLIG